MTDIVERLRERAGKYDEYDWHGAIELEAADEIERLRADLISCRGTVTLDRIGVLPTPAPPPAPEPIGETK